MSDPSVPDPDSALDVEIDLAAFLPDGVTVDPDPAPGPAAADRLVAPGPIAGGAAAAAAAAAEGAADEEPVSERRVSDEQVPETVTGAPADARPGPGDSDIDVALLDAVEQDLDAVDAALRSLDDGTYGTCAVCGAGISPEALAFDPVRRTCTEHA